jgi:hypothetical protein
VTAGVTSVPKAVVLARVDRFVAEDREIIPGAGAPATRVL